MFCNKCGSNISDESKFCSVCGALVMQENESQDAQQNDVQNQPLEQGQANYQPSGSVYGQNYNAPNQPYGNNGANVVTDEQKKKKTVVTIISVVVAIIIAIIAFTAIGNASKPNFEEIYYEYCSSSWASCASDGTYLRVDTNPYDFDDEGLYYIEAYYAIEKINAELGLPESLLEEMVNTTGNMGKQSRVYEKLEVTWSYHPDKGLEVMYILK